MRSPVAFWHNFWSAVSLSLVRSKSISSKSSLVMAAWRVARTCRPRRAYASHSTQHRTRNVRDAQGQAPDDSARQSRGPDVIKSQSKVEQLSSGTLGSSYVVNQVPLHYQNLNLRDRGRNFSTTSGDSRTYEPCWRLTHEEGAFRQSPDISCYSPVANTEDRRTSDGPVWLVIPPVPRCSVTVMYK